MNGQHPKIGYTSRIHDSVTDLIKRYDYAEAQFKQTRGLKMMMSFAQLEIVGPGKSLTISFRLFSAHAQSESTSCFMTFLR